ncbi:TolB family protein [Roseivirga misakiensis]|uniref:DUF5050 domain-containing protein n=1 Tax=Roseivirga misakiensis TaxID=1563681 RepID=A0A1E5T0J8_9BACT|nr:DPP IV N-terminal domain-containing protein [Roseivirga misakiensis]OEK04908.1 hypothetical protein BFP71_15845 [Roseivirga misakiensis]
MRNLIYISSFILIVSCSPKDTFNGSEVIVYVKSENGEKGLFKSDILGKWERKLVDRPGPNWNPQWNKGLDRLIYYSNDSKGKFQMKAFDPNTKSVQFFKNFGFDTPMISADGKGLFYTRLRDGSRHIWRSDLDGSNRSQLTIGLGLNGPFSLSPDGKKMAYVSNYSGKTELYVVDLNSLEIGQLTDNDMVEQYSTWSPDSKKIAFTMRKSEANSQPDIYIIDKDGSNLNQLTKTPYAELELSWSLSGEKIAFHGSTENDGEQIYTIDIADGKFTKITSGDYQYGEPTWVPDSQQN